MEINAEKTKLMTNNTSGINTEIKVNGQKLETVTSFKYLDSVITDDGSKPDIPVSYTHLRAHETTPKPDLFHSSEEALPIRGEQCQNRKFFRSRHWK